MHMVQFSTTVTAINVLWTHLQIIELVEALRQMGRNDLAVIVLPLNRMHLLEKKKKKKKKGEESDDDEDDDDDEEEAPEGGDLPPLPPT